ncbi:hypothetical protein Nepgr_027870 [Nepenthes gracilis]|uniref:FAF domain-containing protein n=1 Tax=Nepenthes gracilis TaxID=150966 RepID=A0AAD3TCI4_NEPGR|nr:hypothetical protein Nepgr_027870 [Nepenthes gracilis]
MTIMSASVCQGLQSCLEPRLVQQRLLWLKLAPPPSKFTEPLRPPLFDSASGNSSLFEETKNKDSANTFDGFDKKGSKTDDLGGWSFLQALAHASPISKGVNEKAEYVHPMAKRCASVLSERSLEMCTESLGSETGSTISERSGEFSCLLPDNERVQQHKLRDFSAAKKSKLRRSFPPPLTTLTGVQLKGHREDGRLVIMAVAVQSSKTCFKAERRDGRLRLHFLKDFAELVCEDDDVMENVEEDGSGGDDVDSEDGSLGYGGDDDDEDRCEGKDMEGIGGTVGVEIGVAEDSHCSRRREGGGTNGEMMAWECLWLAAA